MEAKQPTELVRLLRRELGLRQVTVARLTGLPQSSVSRIEAGSGLSPYNTVLVMKTLAPPELPAEPANAGPVNPWGSEQCSVVSRPSGLRPYLLQAFEDEHVQIDFAGFSGETLHAALQEPLDRVREKSLTPNSLKLRVLVPDLSRPQGLPARADTGDDDPALRERSRKIIARSVQSLNDVVYELTHRELLTQAEIQVRTYSGIPQIKLYSLNRREIFMGYYPVEPNTVQLGGHPVTIHDLMGRDTVLFRHRATEDPQDLESLQVHQAHLWFDSMWERYAKEIHDTF